MLLGWSQKYHCLSRRDVGLHLLHKKKISSETEEIWFYLIVLDHLHIYLFYIYNYIPGFISMLSLSLKTCIFLWPPPGNSFNLHFSLCVRERWLYLVMYIGLDRNMTLNLSY